MEKMSYLFIRIYIIFLFLALNMYPVTTFAVIIENIKEIKRGARASCLDGNHQRPRLGRLDCSV